MEWSKANDIAEALVGKVIKSVSLGSANVTIYFTDDSRLEVNAEHGYSDEPGYYGSDPFPEISFQLKS